MAGDAKDVEKGAVDAIKPNDEAPGSVQLFWLLVWMAK
jgi:hypothetical protein